MLQLFVPLTGAFQQVAGSGFNTYGENLDRPHWHGAELGGLETFPDVWGAVSEAEFHDWILGVHHPLYKKDGPAWCRFLDRDPVQRQLALDVAASAAESAHHLGARYILFHFPWPGLAAEGVDYPALGWPASLAMEPLADWSEQQIYEVSRRVFEHLANVQEKERIQIILEIDGPNPYFFDGELYSRLFEEYPELSLCLDTGRLGLLARTHGQDPLQLCRRWLPWTRHVHLHTSMWDDDGTFHNHLPTNGTHTVDQWPRVTPAADMVKLVAAAQPRLTVVLEHDPRAVSPEALEEAHRWAAELAAPKEAG